MEKQKTRDEIEEQYKWDLTPIFSSDEEFYQELENVQKEVETIENYRGNITKDAESLLSFLKFSDTLERKLYKLYYYAQLTFDADTTNATSQQLKGKVELLLTLFSEKSAFVSPELLKTPYEVIQQYGRECEELQEYAFVLESIYRYQPHQLSEEQNTLLSVLSESLSSASNVYEVLTDSDMKFGSILNEEGKEVELTDSNYSIFLHSQDRKVRKAAFQKMYEVYASFKNTLSKTFSDNVDYFVGMAKLKKYPSSLAASLFQDNIDVSVYDNVIDTVSHHLDVIYKYYALKKKILQVDELHLYDIYAELIPELDKKYAFEEAKDLVINALSILGGEYTSVIRRAFDERWIDVYNIVGKRGGAYSSGFYDTNPYVLLNYEGKLNDVSTLAHELGHSMHTYYSCQNNPYQTSQYQIFVAEVASTTNELLLSHYLLQHTEDPKEKLAILNQLMELFKATIFRQTMFAEFERKAHAMRENGDVLTSDVLSNEYYALNKKYFGKDVCVDDEIRYEWERVPHFYYDFYVYKYVIGLSCACYIVENIESGSKEAKENYLRFLQSGGSAYPSEELTIAGIDITKKDVIESAIHMFEKTIDEFQTLYEQIEKN